MLSVKQWRDDPTKISAGISGIYKRNGYRERRQRDADARIVRTLDFEKALAQLNNSDQSMLISAFYLGPHAQRDGRRHRHQRTRRQLQTPHGARRAGNRAATNPRPPLKGHHETKTR